MTQQGIRIMLVDDEPDLLEVCAETLSDLAQDIVLARNGLEAVENLGKSSFDIIITDLSMPGADGRHVLRTAAAVAPSTDVIVLTAYGTIDSAVECVKLGAVNYLLKPFKLDELRRAVTKALEERTLRSRQAKAGALSRMMDLNSALTGQSDLKALAREFLTQVKNAFNPEGLAFFVQGGPDSGLASSNLLGPYFRDNPAVRSWFEVLAGSLISKGRPLLLEEPVLREAFGRNGNARPPRSAMGAAVGGSASIRGAVVAIRSGDGPPYTLEELNLLTLFAAHASLCFESQSACARLKTVNDEIVFSLVHAVEAKDPYTRGHSERVSRYAVKLAQSMGFSDEEVALVRTAGVLHDIGKIGVPDHILNKSGPLDSGELPSMRQHPTIARTILGKVESLGAVLPIVYHHHERFDGQGYPGGLKGESIPMLARLVSVVDGFEAMTSDRAYHQARSVETAKDILTRGSGTQWDPRFVSAWIDLIGNGASA